MSRGSCARCIESDRGLATRRLAAITSTGEQRVREVEIELLYFIRDLRGIRCCSRRVRDEANAIGARRGVEPQRVAELIEIVKRGPWWVDVPVLLDAEVRP